MKNERAYRSARGLDRLWYWVVWQLGTFQMILLVFFVKKPVWRSFDGTVNTPDTMTSKHLINTVRMLERNRETDSYQYKSMVAELHRRARERVGIHGL